MTDDLIERLHSCEYVAYYDGEPGIVADENLLHEAADRIETQANTIEELRSANERWVIAFNQAEDDATGRIETLQAAVMAVVDAVRDYLPPDGISEKDFISRVIGAVDNPTINPVIFAIEAALQETGQ